MNLRTFLNDVAMGFACGMALLLNPIGLTAVVFSSETLRHLIFHG